MTRPSVREYLAALRPRYRRSSRRQKSRLLSEASQLTGYHRKSLLRLLGRRPRERAPQPRGRRRRYDADVGHALYRLWQASGELCSKRLVPFLPELLQILERLDSLALEPRLRAPLLSLSPATADRLLRPLRHAGRHQPWSHHRALTSLQRQVPLRTFGDWTAATPGAVQADLVAHCGDSTAGFYLATLLIVDVASSWTECQPLWGLYHRRITGAVHQIRQRLPVPLRELHTDNGGEFLNHLLVPYCRQTGVHLTRGRPYRKNDQAYVEQKNWSVVRRLVGYDRYASRAAFAQLQRLYPLLGHYVNFFQPVRKLIAKQRHGARLTKRYDTARTPYQRLLASGLLTPLVQQALAAQYLALNPLTLRAEIDATLRRLWKLAERSTLR